jgi:hypothetical protein
MNSKIGLASELPDVRMVTAKGYPLSGDVVMDTAKAGTTVKHLRLWQKELLESAEVKRKATVAQLCEFRSWPRSVLNLKLTSVQKTSLIIIFKPLGILPLVDNAGTTSIRTRQLVISKLANTPRNSDHTAGAKESYCENVG